MDKGLLQSKTFWSNIIMAVLAVANGQFGDIIPSEVVLVLIPILNIALRIITYLPIAGLIR
ncbi:MAG TPA: hypothetical protein DCQ64_12045 [Candidatus Rokubacteria bacterium]|nr:hypothetical protein [Candidatus Rokubacteria bacterium]